MRWLLLTNPSKTQSEAELYDNESAVLISLQRAGKLSQLKFYGKEFEESCSSKFDEWLQSCSWKPSAIQADCGIDVYWEYTHTHLSATRDYIYYYSKCNYIQS